MNTPLLDGKKISKTNGQLLEDHSLYRSIIGEFQYCILISLNIVYLVNKLCQFLQCPTEVHWSSTKGFFDTLMAPRVMPYFYKRVTFRNLMPTVMQT